MSDVRVLLTYVVIILISMAILFGIMWIPVFKRGSAIVLSILHPLVSSATFIVLNPIQLSVGAEIIGCLLTSLCSYGIISFITDLTKDKAKDGEFHMDISQPKEEAFRLLLISDLDVISRKSFITFKVVDKTPKGML